MDSTIISLAPMEGMTGFVVRNAFCHNFPGIDRYYTPFIPAGKRLNKKYIRDISAENNSEVTLIPQLISREAEEVIYMCKTLAEYGYSTFNLNLGCPSGTVTPKGRGAGFLRNPDDIDRFLDAIFSDGQFAGEDGFQISVKTRIGMDDSLLWNRIVEVYNKYPLEELIIHPRIGKQMYKGTVDLDAYEYATEHIESIPLCYNGDVTSISSYNNIRNRFPETNRVMVGRGFFAHPGLIFEIRDGELPSDYKKRMKDYHDEVYDGLNAIFTGETDVVMHMKSIWQYLKEEYPEASGDIKKLIKAKKPEEYKSIAGRILG